MKKLVKEVMSAVGCFCIGLAIAYFISFYGEIDIIQGCSMQPTFHEGNVALLNKTKADEVQQSDIIVFKNKLTGNGTFIKRVIAVGEDVIEFSGKDVIVNREVIDEDYITPMEEDYEEMVVEVPEGEVFVMGDNRPNSNDSRAFGCIKVEDIKGVVIR